MADQRITQLSNNTTIDDADLVVIVDDVAGTPVTEKRTVGQLKTHIAPNASDTAAGIVELATTAETNTGTDTTRAVTPDAIAGSYAGTQPMGAYIVEAGTDVATGDGVFYFPPIPAKMNGMNLVSVTVNVLTAGTTGTSDFQIHNVSQAADMLSTKATIDSGETSTSTAATPLVIDTTNDDVATGDVLRVDCDAVSTTAPQGLTIMMEFRLP